MHTKFLRRIISFGITLTMVLPVWSGRAEGGTYKFSPLESSTVLTEGCDAVSFEGTSVHNWNDWFITGVAEKTASATLVKDPASTQTFDNSNKVIKMARTEVTSANPEAGIQRIRKNLVNNGTLAGLEGKIKTEVKLYPNLSDKSKLAIYLRNDSGGLYTEGGAFAVLTLRAGNIYTEGKNGGGNTIVSAYPASGWFTLGIVSDEGSNTFDIYINGLKINSEAMAFYGDYKTDPDMTKLSQIGFDIRRDSTTAGTWYLDDLSVKTLKTDITGDGNILESPYWATAFSEDFQEETYLSGQSAINLRTEEGLGNWKVVNFLDTDRKQESRLKLEDSTGEKSLQITRTAAGDFVERPYWLLQKTNGTLEKVNGKILLGFTFITNSNKNETKVEYAVLDNSGKPIVNLGFWGTNIVNIANSEYSVIATGAYGSWTDLVYNILLDTGTRTYDVYYQGTKVNAEPIPFAGGTDKALAADNGCISQMYFGMMRANTASSWLLVDNLFVKQYSEYGDSLWDNAFSDDLESASSYGKSVHGTKNWVISNATNSQSLNTTYERDSLISYNNLIKVSRKSLSDTDESAVKTVSQTPLEGFIITKVKLKTPAFGGDFTVKLLDGNNIEAAQAFINNKGKIVVDGTETAALAENTWLELAIAVNTDTNKYYVYADGQQLNSAGINIPAEAAGISKIMFNYTGFAGEWYVDDIYVGRGFAGEYKISDAAFMTSNGEFAPYPTDGGSLSMVTLYKGREVDCSARIIAALYNKKDENILDLRTAEIDKNLPVGSEIYVNLSLDMPLENAKDYTVKIFLWDISQARPVTDVYHCDENEVINIYVASDSTAATYTNWNYPMTGWGQVLGNYYNHEKVAVQNHATSGRSAKSFIYEGRLKTIFDEIGGGDYLFIQFGHNDQKASEPYLYAEASTAYKAYLTAYIEGALMRGANPVLVTPPVRRYFAADGTVSNSLLTYPDEMRNLAGELGVPLIDLNTMSKALVEGLGAEGSKEIYMYINPRDERYINDPEFANSNFNKGTATEDLTHFNKFGANLLAELISGETENLYIGNYLNK
jgi:lysophospholipase L1-like esterase